jgi:hypothetical protein
MGFGKFLDDKLGIDDSGGIAGSYKDIVLDDIYGIDDSGGFIQPIKDNLSSFSDTVTDDILGDDPSGAGLHTLAGQVGAGLGVGALGGGIGGQVGGDAQGYQDRALDYMIESERVPQELRNQSLEQLDLINNDPNYRASYIDTLRDDPFYQQSLQDSEQSVLRNASATGNLRSGNTAVSLGQLAPQLLQDTYNQRVGGLEAMAYGTPSNANAIAGQYNNMANTSEMARLGAIQSQQNQLGTLGGLGLGVASLFFSDPSLKENIKLCGTVSGCNWYSWDWNEKAKGFGLNGSSEGVMADEVEEVYPHLVHQVSGVKTVNYEALLNG